MSTLIIAAHPDDEVLGAGGYMVAHPGCLVAIMSEGTSSRYVRHAPTEIPSLKAKFAREDQALQDEVQRKRAATKAAIEAVHGTLVYEGDFEDQTLAVTNQALHRAVANLITGYQPTVVLTHHPQEQNADHRVIAEVVGVACRAFTPAGTRITKLLHFIVDAWASAAAAPSYNFLHPLTDRQLEAKLHAVAYYKEELRPWPHPRNLEALTFHARWLGALSGSYAAEPYLLGWGRLQ